MTCKFDPTKKFEAKTVFDKDGKFADPGCPGLNAWIRSATVPKSAVF